MKIHTVLWVIWTLALLAILLMPLKFSIFPPEGFRYWDKVVHFGLFIITGIMSIYGTGFLTRFGYRIIFALIFGLVLAVGTEFGQSLVATRSTSMLDLLADVVGLFLGLVVYALLYRHEGIRQRLRL
jgi:VanZ family protein